MNILAGILILLNFEALGFYTASVDIANSTITSQTNYTFTLALTSSYPTIPARFRIVIVLPSKFTLISPVNTLPNYCTVSDFTEIVIKTLYDPLKPSVGQTDSDYDGQCGVTSANTITIVTPFAIPVMITFKLGLIVNPNIAYKGSNLGNILFYGYNEGSSTNSYYYSYAFGDNRFNPGEISLLSFTQDNLNVGGWSLYTYSVKINQNIPSDGWIILSFTSDSTLKIAAETTITGTLNSGSSVNMGASISGTTVTATGLLTSGASKDNTLLITIYQVKNPKFVGYSSGIIYTATNANEYIEKGSVVISSINPCVITLTGYIPMSKLVYANTQIALYFSNDIYDASTTNQFSFKISFPSAYLVQSTSTCTNAGGLSTSPSLSCTVATNQFTSNLVTQIDKTVSLRLNSIINPHNNATTDYIKIYLYTSANVLICMNEQLVNFTADPGSLSVSTKSRNTAYVADPGPYKLTFTTSTIIPTGGHVKVVIPLDQFLETTGVQCYESSSPLNICTKASLPLDSSTMELTMTEWCSAIDTSCSSCCSAGTVLSLTLQGIGNTLYYNPLVNSQIRVYTYNSAMTGVIDMTTSAGQFSPVLICRSVTGGVSRIGDVVQLSTNLHFQFTSATQYIAEAYVIVYLPQNAAFPQSSGVNCYNSANGITCTYELFSDGSIKNIKFYPCSSGCNTGTSFDLSVVGIRNPDTVGGFSGSFTMMVFYSGYEIESGSFVSSINSLVPNVISSTSLSRTSYVVSSPHTLTISFNIASKIPVGGALVLSLPQDLLTLDSSLSIYKSSTLLSYTGSLTSMTITGYCTSECPGGTQIKLDFKGIKNLSSVKSVVGTITITSTYVYTIDTGSFEVFSLLSTLVPGEILAVDIHPENPQVSVSTTYRIIFTTEHSIQKDSYIEITFPAGPMLLTTILCESFLTIDSSLVCSLSSRTVKITNGFSIERIGSHMVGLLIFSITNPGSALSYSPFTIITKDINGYIIDQYISGSVLYKLPTSSCSCSQCAGDICWECLVPSDFPLLSEYSCQETCADNQFLASSNPLTCIKCHYTCASCNSQYASDCTSCPDGRYKSDGFCVEACPEGTILINNECSSLNPCISPCSTCSLSPDYCFTCTTGILITGTGLCTNVCPDGYYANGNICEECSTKCATCLGDDLTCTSCYNYYYEQYLDENSCVEKCPEGVSVLDSGVCVYCDITCKTCSDIGPNGCDSCSGSLYLSESSCVEECPDGFYRFDGNVCVGECLEGFYVTEDLKDCFQCFSDCATCLDYEICTSCQGELYLFEGTCVNPCPSSFVKFSPNLCISEEECSDGLYIDGDECFACPEECKTCTSYTTCTLCIDTFYLSGDSCVSVCPDGFLKFSDNTCIPISSCGEGFYILDDFCYPCDSTCNTCDGGTNLDCTSCSDYLYLYLTSCLVECPAGFFRFTENVCIETCPAGYFITDDLKDCNICDPNCLTCSGPDPNDCTGCYEDTPYLLPDSQCAAECLTGQFLYESICYEICPEGTLAIVLSISYCTTECPSNYYISDGYCLPCSSGCAECLNSSTCTTCLSGFSMTVDNQCVSQCPDGYISIDGICIVKCDDDNCIDCTISHPEICKKCSDGFIIYNSTCVEICPDNFYLDNSKCFPCSNDCDYCENADLCYECFEGKFLLDGKCVSLCPSGYYSKNDVCSDCDLSCSTCESASLCTSCKDSFLMFDNFCYAVCPDRTIPINGTCVYTCPESCATCDKGYCNSCENGYLYNKDCVIKCPDGFYGIDNLCFKCSNSCLTCTSEDFCLTCEDSYLFNNSCVENCPDKTITEDSICKLLCSNKCKTCDFDGCYECDDGYIANDGVCEECPEGTYYKDFQCEKCSANCTKCYNETICIECMDRVLYNGLCLDGCPDGFSASSGICIKISYSQTTYAVYPLIGEIFIIISILIAGSFIYSDSFLLIPSALALFSTSIFSCKIALIAVLWTNSTFTIGILLPITVSLVIGTSTLAIMFLYLHIETFQMTNASLSYYSLVHKKFYVFIKVMSILCGTQFFRVIYSGIFGLSATTEVKGLAISSKFRYPLEKLCFLNSFIVTLPLIIACVVLLSIHSINTDVWQVSMITLAVSIIVEGVYAVSYVNSPWWR